MAVKKAENIQELLTRGVQDIIVKKSLTNKLRSGKKLRVKLGIDPTAPKLHIGHTVVLRKLRQFQELGHHIIFLVGDFTARIGDPTDKLSARKPLEEKDIKRNMKSYVSLASKVLDIDTTEVRYNSEWHQRMDFAELFRLTSHFTVNHMLERDMFQKRMKEKKPLWVHELMYPILQGYDSVALRADVEIGGTDQTFNVLAARDIQPHYHQLVQDIMTVPLLEGTDGTEKMSKSVGNTIDIDDAPADMYGKTMSIPDNLIIKYFTLVTDVSMDEITLFEREMKAGSNPRDFKARLARELVTMYHSAAAAKKAEEQFAAVFKDKGAPADMPTYHLSKPGSYSIIDIVIETKLAPSKSEARRLVAQGAVTFDGKKIDDWQVNVRVAPGMVLRVGKRKFVKFV